MAEFKQIIDDALDILKFDGAVQDTLAELREKWGAQVPALLDERFDAILLENVPGLAPTSLLLLEQLRTIDRKRLRGYIGRISKEKMLEVDAALAISIGIGYPNERRTHNV